MTPEEKKTLIELAAKHGIAKKDFPRLADYWGDIYDDIFFWLDEGFCGIYKTFQDYADELADNFVLDGVNDRAAMYFDYEKHARDLQIECVSIELSNGVAVFN